MDNIIVFEIYRPQKQDEALQSFAQKPANSSLLSYSWVYIKEWLAWLTRSYNDLGVDLQGLNLSRDWNPAIGNHAISRRVQLTDVQLEIYSNNLMNAACFSTA